jgi:hypothetical protein
MRLSDLLGVDMVDESGRRIATVRDVRLATGADGLPTAVAGLVVGDGLLAGPSHGFGFVADRAAGPWPLRRLAGPARRAARFVAAGDVVAWGPDAITVRSDARLVPIDEALAP